MRCISMLYGSKLLPECLQTGVKAAKMLHQWWLYTAQIAGQPVQGICIYAYKAACISVLSVAQ